MVQAGLVDLALLSAFNLGVVRSSPTMAFYSNVQSIDDQDVVRCKQEEIAEHSYIDYETE